MGFFLMCLLLYSAENYRLKRMLKNVGERENLRLEKENQYEDKATVSVTSNLDHFHSVSLCRES